MNRSGPLRVHGSSLHRNQAAHQECLTANPQAFLAASHRCLIQIYMYTQTLLEACRCQTCMRLLQIFGKHIVMLPTNVWSPEHEQTLKQAFQTISSQHPGYNMPLFAQFSCSFTGSFLLVCVCVFKPLCESNAISNSFLCRWHRLTSLWLH